MIKDTIDFITDNYELLAVIIIISLLILLVLEKIIYKRKVKSLNQKIENITGIAATKIIYNMKMPGTKNIINMFVIHPSGIYLINKIKHSGSIRGTLMMDNWEIETQEDKKTFKIKNPVKEMKENEKVIRTMLKEPIYPVIIFKNNAYCHVLDGWLNENQNLMLIKEYEQEKIFKNKEYSISYTRAEDIYRNMLILIK